MEYQEIVEDIIKKNSELINQIKEECKDIKEKKDIDVLDWMRIISELIQFVETYKNLTGKTKQRIILEICLRCVEQTEFSDKNKYIVKEFIKFSLPKMIDMMVKLSKVINTKGKVGKCLSKSLLCVFGSKIPEPKDDIDIGEKPEEK